MEQWATPEERVQGLTKRLAELEQFVKAILEVLPEDQKEFLLIRLSDNVDTFLQYAP